MDNKPPQLSIKNYLSFIFYLAILPTILFLSAGTIKWGMGWIYSGLIIAVSLISRILVFKKNPSLLIERSKFNQGEGTQSWDRFLLIIVSIIFPIICLVTAGLDYRFEWSPAISQALQYLAVGIILFLSIVGTWAMVENPYFSASVRIQQDRGQVVISTGPYKFVRHPGYSSAVVSNLVFPIVLGTLWTLIPAVLTIGLIILRTALEDQMLQEDLPGYKEYASQVRFRLIPGFW